MTRIRRARVATHVAAADTKCPIAGPPVWRSALPHSLEISCEMSRKAQSSSPVKTVQWFDKEKAAWPTLRDDPRFKKLLLHYYLQCGKDNNK